MIFLKNTVTFAMSCKSKKYICIKADNSAIINGVRYPATLIENATEVDALIGMLKSKKVIHRFLSRKNKIIAQFELARMSTTVTLKKALSNKYSNLLNRAFINLY